MSLIACLPCRVKSTRLYGKPLQLIDVENNISILEYLVTQIRQQTAVKKIVLAVSEEEENRPFFKLAEKLKIRAVAGDSEDVLSRMILAAQSVGGKTVLRITSECPFIYFDHFSDIYHQHLVNKADLTVIENLPDGAYYELVETEAFVKSYEEGHRGAWVTLYIQKHPEKFRIQKLEPPQNLKRPDLRITVDYPEDLIAVRKIYKDLKGYDKVPSIDEIIRYLDANEAVKNLVLAHQAGAGRIWA